MGGPGSRPEKARAAATSAFRMTAPCGCRAALPFVVSSVGSGKADKTLGSWRLVFADWLRRGPSAGSPPRALGQFGLGRSEPFSTTAHVAHAMELRGCAGGREER